MSYNIWYCKVRKFIEESWEEATWGLLIGLGFGVVIGVQAILLGIATGVLFRLGGMGLWGTKAWRRLGVPSVIAVFVFSKVTLLPMIISVVCTVLLLSLGYGSRSTQPPDEGSPFGNWCLKVTRSELGGKVLSRGLIIIAIWGVWYVSFLVGGR